MPEVSVLDVLLHGKPIGNLTLVQGLRTLFTFDQDYIDAVDKAERERKEREALEWAAAEVVAGDDDMKGDD